MSDDFEGVDFQQQADIFRTLGHHTRLRVLMEVAERQPVSAPELDDDIDVSAESIKKNLNRLEDAGFLESSRERGPGNRPRDEYTLPDEGVMVQLDVVPDDYNFYFGSSDVA